MTTVSDNLKFFLIVLKFFFTFPEKNLWLFSLYFFLFLVGVDAKGRDSKIMCQTRDADTSPSFMDPSMVKNLTDNIMLEISIYEGEWWGRIMWFTCSRITCTTEGWCGSVARAYTFFVCTRGYTGGGRWRSYGGGCTTRELGDPYALGEGCTSRGRSCTLSWRTVWDTFSYMILILCCQQIAV